MAIQTRGFGVQVMPQYTPVNANLASYAPAQILGGALDSFKVAQAYNALKAQVDEANERNQLRPDRLAATRAGYRGVVRQEAEGQATSIGRVSAENARNKSVTELTPAQTEDALGDLDLKKGDREFAKSVQNLKNEITRVGIESAANSAIVKAQADEAQAELSLKAARDALQNFDQNSMMAKEIKKLQIREIESKIKENEANAEYLSGRNSAASKSNKTPQEIDAETAQQYTNLVKSVLSKKAPGSNETLEAYRNRTRDETGKIDVNPSKLNPDNEREIAAIENMERFITNYMESVNAYEKAKAQNDAYRALFMQGFNGTGGAGGGSGQSQQTAQVQTFTIDPDSGELIPVQ